MSKKTLRREIMAARDEIAEDERAAGSLAIARRLYSLTHFSRAATLMIFVPFGSEVDTAPVFNEALARGMRVLVPRTIPAERKMVPSRVLDWEEDLRPGAYGIREPVQEALRPVSPLEIDLLLVPGVAFDSSGNRLGYGGGYYDRFFARLRPETPLVAPVFDLQVLPSVPVDPWDRPVDMIITEQRLIRCQFLA